MTVGAILKRAHYQRRKLARRSQRLLRTAPRRLKKLKKRGRRGWARPAYTFTLTLVPTRSELAELLNRRRLLGRGAEVGVRDGGFSRHLLAHWDGAQLVSIDPWEASPGDQYVDISNVSQDAHDELYARTLERLAPFGARSVVWRATSVRGSEWIPPRSLDFVYIDARHDYESVKEDLEAWFDKVRSGGIIAGHDYVDGVLAEGVFGVRSAVDEFFGARDLPVRTTRRGSTWMVAAP